MTTIGKAFKGNNLHDPQPDWAGLPEECSRCWDAASVMTSPDAEEELCEACLEEIARVTKTPRKKITPENMIFLKNKADALTYADEHEDRQAAEIWAAEERSDPGWIGPHPSNNDILGTIINKQITDPDE